MLLKTPNLNSSTTFTFKRSKGILQKANKHKRTHLSSFNATHHFRVSRYFGFSTNEVTHEAETPPCDKPGPAPRGPGPGEELSSPAGSCSRPENPARNPSGGTGCRRLTAPEGRKDGAADPYPGGLAAAQGLPLRLTCACGGG